MSRQLRANTGKASGPQCPILHPPSSIHADANATDSDIDPHFHFAKTLELMCRVGADAYAALMQIQL